MPLNNPQKTVLTARFRSGTASNRTMAAFGRGFVRFATTDDSRNHWLLALITMGEGWHNNHHHYMMSVRQGFRWWEIDMTYYCLKAMEWLGLVWDIKDVPIYVREQKSKQEAIAV